MKIVISVLIAFCFLYPFVSFGEEQIFSVKANELKLKDVMPSFEYDSEDVLFPENDDRFIFYSIEREERSLDDYKNRLHDLLEEFDRFQGRY
jgi:hypothetical protein